MKQTRWFSLAVAAGFALACPSAVVLSNEAVVDRGAELLAPFKADLKAALEKGVMAGIPAAISVCKEDAPDLAALYSVDGVVMGRSSHRLRNPSNTAPSWVDAAVEGYLDSGSDPQPVHTSLEDGRRGYVEPIMTQPVCLACHGETLAPEVASKIAAEYPDDQATGFDIGDLRGVFWVEYPGEIAESPGNDNGG